MRALQSCDFCGADAVGTFEIVPPELEPTEAEQRRAVLCGDCKDRLEDLLEPLLARTEADGRATEPSGDEKTTDEEDAAVASAGDSTAQCERSGRSNATVSDGTETGETKNANVDQSERDADDVDRVDDAGDGIALEREAAADSTVDSSNMDPEPNDTNSESAPSAAGSAPARAADSRASAPKAYGKVVRLLRNREFPMDRRAVEGLAAGAYDLESHEVDAILEHAIERGEFREGDGKLYRA